ncbi:MAG: UDP-N-acetylmuramoylalanyl-D-glutamate--2,6-diaminopimelate ligase [Tissierellia bacterium]|nr:UDP-N-acetylmuramoylalanyl-D-glutamate--2,6-diaminopimelate ligase [Tissierellia bacterium]
MILKNLLEEVKYEGSNKDLDLNLDIANLAYHTDDVVDGSMFIAIKGLVTDGHKYISVAKEKGAVAVMVEEYTEDDILQIKFSNIREAMADIAQVFYNYPEKEMYKIGITATNGKTTTSFMTNAILREAGIKTGIIGTVEISYDDVLIPSLLTTPESVEMQKHMRGMIEHGIKDLVMEVSSSGMESLRVRNINYDIVTFNNFSREHIDQHGSFEKYWESKSSLIRNAKEDAVAILNMDEEKISTLVNETKAKVLTYSLDNQDYDFGIENLDISTGIANYDFVVNRDIELKDRTIKKGKFNVQLNIAGYSSVMNSVVAIIIGLVRGIDSEVIVRSLKKFGGVERRFEMIYNHDFKIIDDHFANMRNIEVTLSTLMNMDYNNLKMVYGIRGNRGLTLNGENAEAMCIWLKKLGVNRILATSSVDTVGPKDTVSSDEYDIFMKIMGEADIEIDYHDRLDETVKQALSEVNDGDILLLAGCQGIDPAGRMALEFLAEGKDEDTRKIILDPIKDRVC